ncbi:MAG TPA: dimethyladenosine transferase [Firmicutes bacterium]|nr:dimethyladenosine transferase [Bacillota bacterium]
MGVIMDLLVVLFNGFETLDVFGPVEVLGRLENISKISFVSLAGGLITSSQQVPVITEAISSLPLQSEYILLVPGGSGVRNEVENERLLEIMKQLTRNAQFVLSVCTGAVLLAKIGILDHKKATTNKRSFDWVMQQGTNVSWVKKARWVKDQNIYTSSGVSAGIDMALGFIADTYGEEQAEVIANRIEYSWNKDSEADMFYSLY